MDILPGEGIDLLGDITRLPFSDGTAEEILANDVLEHFPWRETRQVLREWRRVLGPTGQLCLRTPDLEGLLRLYRERPAGWRREEAAEGGIDPIVERLYGGQDYDTNFHYVIFDKTSLADLLEEEGFLVESITPDGNDITNMCARAFKILRGEEVYEGDTSCPRFDSCRIVREFLETVGKREVIHRPPIEICAKDLRFYRQKTLTDEVRHGECPRLKELAEEIRDSRITWEGPTFGASGYAYAARGYMLGLADLGVRLRSQPIWGDCEMVFEDEDGNAQGG
jgi:predicted SAM-dependent methyltransferase